MRLCPICQHQDDDVVVSCPNDESGVYRIFEPGTLLKDKYRILELIGRGGMALVYRARHEVLNKERIVRIYDADFTEDD